MTETTKSKKNLKQQPTDPIMYGKVPPQATQLEEVVLGAIMLESRVMDNIAPILTPECFYKDAHQRIFKAMLKMHHKNESIDLMTVVQQLRKTEELEAAGGPYFITTLTNSVTSSAHTPEHAKIIYQLFVKRECIKIASKLLFDAYEDTTDPFDMIDDTANTLSNLAVNDKVKSYVTIADSTKDVINRIDQLRNRPDVNKPSGIESGIPAIDQVTDGWQPSDLIILAARPSVGKSAVAANLARLASLNPHNPTGVGIFSLEMSHTQWTERILSAQSSIFLENIKRANLSDREYTEICKAADIVTNLNLFLDDSPNLNILTLKAKARQMVLQDGAKMIIVDYLQLMNGDRSKGQSREQEISGISRGLKQLAKELKVPIIALSQLSRESDKNGIPKLSDLRESGAIEQDADIVIFLVPPTEGQINDGTYQKDEILIKFAKHRNGALQNIRIKFNKPTQTIYPLSGEIEGGFFKPLPPPQKQNIENDEYLPF